MEYIKYGVSGLAIIGLTVIGILGYEAQISEPTLLFIITAIAGLGGYTGSKISSARKPDGT